ncbi:39S ribosomal protein L4, mitochondrial-like [Gigantopelta aegis]|uniref:39S ribosomal protein L4, mitochondrial-like n=1 Tax=Gigantopelta aegis TaxID=1735272 RepID=UPI001B8897E9|nr:39S ribosomal protein L4, mitochondrial-like [Gigantopelta aegis]
MMASRTIFGSREAMKRLCTCFHQKCHISRTSYSGQNVSEIPSFHAAQQSLPIMTSRRLEYPPLHTPPKQAWLESLDTIEDGKLGIVDLHPEIFGTYPRIDMLHSNILWQRNFKRISYAKTKSRAEVRGGGRKPWPQKGMNKARHGSIRSPIWRGGGIAHGPRGPQSFFYMLPTPLRVMGLRVALSVKYAQNNLHIVDSFDIPSDDSQYITDLIDTRFWGYSVLFVDDTDFMPRNISLALSKCPEFNLMPVYGLNVYSMLKHETLVLTLAAVEKIEQKLLYEMHKTERSAKYQVRRTIPEEDIPDYRPKTVI